jgi:hypothetical protein
MNYDVKKTADAKPDDGSGDDGNHRITQKEPVEK